MKICTYIRIIFIFEVLKSVYVPVPLFSIITSASACEKWTPTRYSCWFSRRGFLIPVLPHYWRPRIYKRSLFKLSRKTCELFKVVGSQYEKTENKNESFFLLFSGSIPVVTLISFRVIMSAASYPESVQIREYVTNRVKRRCLHFSESRWRKPTRHRQLQRNYPASEKFVDKNLTLTG